MNVIFRPNLSTSLPALVIELLRGGGGACLLAYVDLQSIEELDYFYSPTLIPLLAT